MILSAIHHVAPQTNTPNYSIALFLEKGTAAAPHVLLDISCITARLPQSALYYQQHFSIVSGRAYHSVSHMHALSGFLSAPVLHKGQIQSRPS